MKRVYAYYKESMDYSWDKWLNVTQDMFNMITMKSKETGEVFKNDAGNLWIYFHERLKKSKKPYLIETFIRTNTSGEFIREFPVAYGFGDIVSKKLNEIKEKQKKELEKQKEIEDKKRDGEINIIVLRSNNPEQDNWYVKDKEGNLTCYPKEALKASRKELKELVLKLQAKYPKKRANGTYLITFDLVDPTTYFEGHIDVVDGEIDDVKYQERGYTGYYDIWCYSKGELKYSYEVSTGCDNIENYLGPLYPNADIPWEYE